MTLVDFLVQNGAPCARLFGCTTCGGALAFEQRVRDYVADPDTPSVLAALSGLVYVEHPDLRHCRATVQSVIRHLQLQPPNRWRVGAGC